MSEKIYIVTPCYRQNNLAAIFASIDFNIIHRWYIVYDTTKGRTYSKIYTDNPQIVELECSDYGNYGHGQRNFMLKIIEDGFIYFVDDDNIVCPNLYKHLTSLNPNYYYTFDQLRNRTGDDTDWILFHNEKGRVLRGHTLKIGQIDTGQILFPRKLIGNLKWVAGDYKADGIFAEALKIMHPESHIYIPETLCYYNYLE
jgi:hypothetical protein